MNMDILTSGTDWGVMHFKYMAYLILFYTGLAIFTAIYLFLIFTDWLKHKCLIAYVQSDSVHGVERVLNAGIDVNAKNIFGKTPLMGVVRYAKEAQMLERILDKADVNIADETGNTPLMVAARYNDNEKIIEMLVYEGANVHTINEQGQNALMVAVMYNKNTAVARALLDSGSDVNAVDSDGKTALMYAAQFNPNTQIIDLLLGHGADKYIRCSSGRTAYDYAHENIELYKTQAYMSLEV